MLETAVQTNSQRARKAREQKTLEGPARKLNHINSISLHTLFWEAAVDYPPIHQNSQGDYGISLDLTCSFFCSDE